MSGIIAAAFALLLTEQAAPHPSTLADYQPPAIRPFEPPSDFGREAAQGSETSSSYRRPLERAVTVDDYRRSYEASPADPDIAYDQGVASAEIRADQSAGALGGYWRAVDPSGAALFDLVLTDDGDRLEGGWRNSGGSGWAVLEDGMLELEGLGVTKLTPQHAGWSGRLGMEGRNTLLVLSRPG